MRRLFRKRYFMRLKKYCKKKNKGMKQIISISKRRKERMFLKVLLYAVNVAIKQRDGKKENTSIGYAVII